MTALDGQLKALSLLVLQLPDVNYHTLRLLLGFMSDVVQHQAWNRMNATNVATVIGPNLFPPKIVKPSRKNTAEALAQGVFHFCLFLLYKTLHFKWHSSTIAIRFIYLCAFLQMGYAAKTNRVTELLLTHQDVIFTIPSELMKQLSTMKL